MWLSLLVVSVGVGGSVGGLVGGRQGECGVPVLENGWVEAQGGRDNKRFVGRLRCQAGYVLTGGELVKCWAGVWNQEIPSCTAVQSCNPETLPVIRNGYRVGIRKNSVYRYKCYPGFQLIGHSAARCSGSEWSDPPVCAKRGCDWVSLVGDGLPYGHATPMYQGSVFRFQCDQGAVMEGSPLVHCDGHRWSSAPPQCLVPPQPPKLTLSKRGQEHDGSPLQLGDTITLTCQSGGGQPRPSLTFLMNGEKMSESVSEGMEGGIEVSLPVTPQLQGAQVSCIAENRVVDRPVYSQFILIQIQFSPQDMSLTGPTIGDIGDTLEYVCSAQGEPAPTITMTTRDPSPSLVPALTTSLLPPTRTATGWRSTVTMTVMAEAALHRLEVTCQAENSLGNTASDIATQIQYGPETVDISGPTEIIRGEDSVFTCSVPLSFPSANIVWTRVISDLEETVSNQDIVTQVSSLLHGVSTRSQYRMYAAPPGVSSLSVYCTVNIPQIGVNMDSDTVEVTLIDLPDQVHTSESDEAGISKEDVSKTEVEATIQLVEQESNDKHQEEDVSMEKNGADISGEGDENINMNEFIETSANDLITTDVAEMELNEIGWHKLSDYNQKEEVAVNADTPHQEYDIDSGIEDVLGEEEEENEDLLGDNFSDYRHDEESEMSADKYDQEYLTDSDIEDILDKERDEYDAENFNSEEDDENDDIFDDEGSDYRQDEESEMSADMHDQEYLTNSEIEEHVEDNEEIFSGEEDDKNENISDDENDGENHTDLEEEGQIDGDDYDEYVKDVTDQADEDMSEMDNYEDYEENNIASEEKLQNSNNEVYETADNDSEMESSAEVEEEDSTDIKINDDHESNGVEENDSITEYDSTEEDDKYKDIEREGFVEYAEGKEEDKIDETKNAIDNVPSELELEDTTEDGSTENYGKKYSEENYKGEKSSENLNIGEAITKKSSLEEYSFDEKEGSAATELEQEVFSQLDTEENTEKKTDIDAAFQEESNIEDSDNDNSNVGTAVILEPVEEDDWNQEDASTMESEVHHNSNTEDDLKTYNAEITYSRGKQESYDFSSVFLPEPEQPQVFLRPEPERIEVQMRSADGPELTADMGSSWALHTDSSGPRLTSDVTTLICSVLSLLYIVCHITTTV